MKANRFSFVFVVASVVATSGGAPLAAQQDPMKEIQEIARRVDEQLQEIDKLLLESGKKGEPRQKPKELLQKSNERSVEVEKTIDDLIRKLTEMKNQSSSSSSQDQQQQDQQQQDEQQQQQQQRGSQRNRRENQMPDMVDRREQQQREQQQQQGEQNQQQQQQQQRRPEDGHEIPDPGQNTTGNRQPEPETGPGQRGAGDEQWGELQSYQNFLKNKGSAPKVPEKFRKYWEAYLKSRQGAGGGTSGK